MRRTARRSAFTTNLRDADRIDRRKGAPDGAPAVGGRGAPTQRLPILARHPGRQRPGGRSPALRLSGCAPV